MDGSPSRGETIPIRLFLGGFDLTPTFRDVNKKFSTRYYLSLVLIDEGQSRGPCPSCRLMILCARLTPHQMRGDTSNSLRSFFSARHQSRSKLVPRRAASRCRPRPTKPKHRGLLLNRLQNNLEAGGGSELLGPRQRSGYRLAISMSRRLGIHVWVHVHEDPRRSSLQGYSEVFLFADPAVT